MKTILPLAILILFACNSHEEPHWSYEGHTGPVYWSKLSSKYKDCALGHHQSPINIDHEVEHSELPPLQLDYRISRAQVVNNGHSIQVNFKDGGVFKAGNQSFQLLQMHFHTPSEEAIHGKRAAFEAHFVHKAEDGKLAVIGILMHPGKRNPVLDQIWQIMPHKPNRIAASELNINALDIIGEARDYYTYEGSLTTPPCTEGVQWFVLTDEREIGSTQLREFQKMYPNNARPVQPVYDRKVQVKH